MLSVVYSLNTHKPADLLERCYNLQVFELQLFQQRFLIFTQVLIAAYSLKRRTYRMNSWINYLILINKE